MIDRRAVSFACRMAGTTIGMLAGLAALQGCQSAPASPARAAQPVATQAARSSVPFSELRTMVDDADARRGVGQFHYVGRWDHASRRTDGRSLGTSSRSFHVGDEVVIGFVGTQIRVYGVRGTKGGYGAVALDHRRSGGSPDFYAATFQPAALVYVSPVLPSGPHTLSVAVTGRRERASQGAYVNIDYAAVSSEVPAQAQ